MCSVHVHCTYITDTLFVNVFLSFVFARITFLAIIVAMQAWLTWSFILYQVSYWNEMKQASNQGSAKKKEQKKKGKKSAEKKDFSEDEDEDEDKPPVSNGKYKTS